MTESGLYEKLMSDKDFNNLSHVTKERLFDSYIKPLLEETEGLRQWVEYLVRENTALKKEIATLDEDYTAEVKTNIIKIINNMENNSQQTDKAVKKTQMQLPSKFQINDDVTFRPMFRHQQEMGIADDQSEGKVIAVKFTEAKIFYDVYSPYHGKIFDGIDSVKVTENIFVHSVELS